jgi:poly-gamma-glutamate capsule biosynthesis protein CapA/YwtB (metallophosphatase superfamily)
VSRWLAGVFAAVCVIGSAVAVWLVVVDDDPGDGRRDGSAPATTSGETPAPDRPKSVRFTVSASGDLLMHQPLLDQALANGGGSAYDFTPFFKPIAPYVDDVDVGLCHMETPMGPGEPTTYPIFNTPAALANSIAKSGWDACSTASNHSVDGGQAGIDGTVEAFDDAKLAHTGSFSSEQQSREPMILKVDGVKVGFVAYTDATNGLPLPQPWSVNAYAAADPKAGAKAIIEDAREAREAGADAVIVQIHWGDENSQTPNRSQIEVAKKLTASKAVTVVVGNGPHMVQPIERINGKFVVFSEGNLVSNQGPAAGLPAATQDGFIALLHFKAKGDQVKVKRVTYIPTWVRIGDYAVLPAKPSADQANAGALQESYDRTVAVAGQGDGFGPEF